MRTRDACENLGMPRRIRLFVSSTFSDMQAERAVLHQRVFPDLREVCAARGFVFEAIDLRWGVSEAASREQRTLAICREEIARSLRISAGTAFLALVGERFGWEPLPDFISADELEALLPLMEEGDANLTRRWYRRDDNAVPPEYVLESWAGELSDPSEWQRIEACLRNVLRVAVTALGIDAARSLRYFASATEREIEQAVLATPELTERSLVFMRTIEGLPFSRESRGFIDLSSAGDPNLEATARQRDLRKRLRNLSAGSVIEYRARWNDGELVAGDLDDFRAAVTRALRARIDIFLQQTSENDVGLETPAQIFAAETSRDFTGRKEAFEALSKYAFEGGAGPRVLTGPSGIGKSTLLAAIFRMADERSFGSVAIGQFVGATHRSLELAALLRKLLTQLRGNEAGEESGRTLEELQRTFHDALAGWTGPRRLILIVDGLDQIPELLGSAQLQWIPRTLPPQVSMLVSAGSKRTAEALASRLGSAALMELEPMSSSEADALLSNWLHAAHRTLQAAQRRVLLDHFASSGLPLYLRLAFDEARHWRSTDLPELGGLTVEELMTTRAGRLGRAREHGAVLVEAVLGLISASRSGLAEYELLDLLSSDRDVMADLARRTPEAPETGELPQVVWSRLYLDLEAYLRTAAESGIELLKFHHRRLEQAIDRCIDPAAKKERHRQLAAYFSRQTEAEPVGLRRAALELPTQQRESGLWSELEKTLLDITFLDRKLSYEQADDLAQDFEGAVRVLPPDRELRAVVDRVGEAIRLDLDVLRRINAASLPGFLFQSLHNRLAGERAVSSVIESWRTLITERKIPWLRAHHATPNVQAILGWRDVAAIAISPSGTVLAAAGAYGGLQLRDRSSGALIRSLFHPWPVSALVFFHDGTHLGIGCGSTVYVWSCDDDTCREELKTAGSIADLAVSGDGRWLVAACARGPGSLWSLSEAAPHRYHLAAQIEDARTVAFAADGSILAYGGDDERVQFLDLEHGPAKSSRLIEAEDHALALAFSSRSRSLALGLREGVVAVWDVDACTPLWRVSIEGASQIEALLWSPDDSLLAVADKSSMVDVRDASDGAPIATLRGHDGAVTDLAFTSDGENLVSGSRDGTVCAWRTRDLRNTELVEEHSAPINALCFSPDGRFLVTAELEAPDGVFVWEVASGRLVHRLAATPEHFKKLVFDASGRILVAAGQNRGIQAWNLENGEKLTSPENGDELMGYVLVNSLGTHFTTFDKRCRLDLWTLEPLRKTHRIQLRDFEGKVAWSPNGRSLAAIDSDLRLLSFDLESATTRALSVEAPTSIAFDAHGRRLAVLTARGEVVIFDAFSGRRLRRAGNAATGSSSAAVRVGFNANGKTLAIACAGEAIELIELESGGSIFTEPLPSEYFSFEVQAIKLAFSDCGSWLTCRLIPGDQRVFDTANGRCIERYSSDVDFDDLARGPIERRWLAVPNTRVVQIQDRIQGRMIGALTRPWKTAKCSPRNARVFVGHEERRVGFYTLEYSPAE